MSMTVDEILEMMIGNWPSLYRSRLSTLDHVFTDAECWADGQPRGLNALEMRDEELDRPLDETLGAHEVKSTPNRALLNKRLDYAKKQFVRDNAALIARAELVGEWHDFRSVPSFSIHHLNKLPLKTMAPEWRAALTEFCQEILQLTDDFACHNPHGYSVETVNRHVMMLATAKNAAEECLIRLGQGSDDAKKARQAMIEKLRRDAAMLGLKLVEA